MIEKIKKSELVQSAKHLAKDMYQGVKDIMGSNAMKYGLTIAIVATVAVAQSFGVDIITVGTAGEITWNFAQVLIDLMNVLKPAIAVGASIFIVAAGWGLAKRFFK